MDLIKSGSYIDIFYVKTCATTKNKHIGRVSCSACNAFIGEEGFLCQFENLEFYEN